MMRVRCAGRSAGEPLELRLKLFSPSFECLLRQVAGVECPVDGAEIFDELWFAPIDADLGLVNGLLP